jgi:hypothetical protein
VRSSAGWSKFRIPRRSSSYPMLPDVFAVSERRGSAGDAESLEIRFQQCLLVGEHAVAAR